MSDRELRRGSRTRLSGRGQMQDELPAPETRRWVARRKAQVVAAVRAGKLSLEDACRRYSLSAEEFGAWAQAIDRHGPSALRVTRLQEFRQG
jgi:transposase-like protein